MAVVPPETGTLGTPAVVDGGATGAAKALRKLEFLGGGGTKPPVDVTVVLLESGALELPAVFDG